MVTGNVAKCNELSVKYETTKIKPIGINPNKINQV
jgi:hypothetical protein